MNSKCMKSKAHKNGIQKGMLHNVITQHKLREKKQKKKRMPEREKRRAVDTVNIIFYMK